MTDIDTEITYKCAQRDVLYFINLIKTPISKQDISKVCEMLSFYKLYDVLYYYAIQNINFEITETTKKEIIKISNLVKMGKCKTGIYDFSIDALRNGLYNPRYGVIPDTLLRYEYDLEKLEDNIFPIQSPNKRLVKSKIVAISDTHGEHANWNIPECDVLICCGDVTRNSDEKQFIDFMSWFSRQKATYKIYVPGNNDGCFWSFKETKNMPENVICLNSETFIAKIGDETIKFYGTPQVVYRENTPNNFFSSHRINTKNTSHSIPKDTDILITHGPPYGIGDLNTPLIRSSESGDYSLRSMLYKLNLKYHFFGHVHEGKGLYISDRIPTIFANVAKSMFVV